MRVVSVGVLLLATLFATAHGHGAVVHPAPRNAVDRDLPPWSLPMPKHLPPVEGALCPAPDASGKITGELGQSCFWFSNGCAIGCDACDGISRGPIMHGSTRPSPYGLPWNRKFDTCSATVKSTAKPTICDERLRTVNTNATCMGPDDIFQFSPWRAPGSAPVFDPCGMAGGHVWPQGGFGGQFRNTSRAKIGDKGSEVLPATDPTVEWKTGDVVEVSWSVMANHGGGYQYRLAPLGVPLTEELFQRMPLAFVGQQQFRWGGRNGTIHSFDGDYVSTGTSPPNSTWVKNPIPRNEAGTGKGFAPHCPHPSDELLGCQGMTNGNNANARLEIVDHLLVPEGLEPGRYVLGWRWDCEESNQIWQSCSDVSIVV